MMQDPLNKVIMEEIGLTVDDQNRVLDQDTRERIKFKDKTVKYSSQHPVTIGNNDIVFDPMNNRTLMNTLFEYYSHKLQEEDDVYVAMHYEQRSEDKSTLYAKVDGKVLESKPYHQEALKYVDVIKQLNGAENVDLSQYDKPIQHIDKKPIRRTTKPQKRGIF